MGPACGRLGASRGIKPVFGCPPAWCCCCPNQPSSIERLTAWPARLAAGITGPRVGGQSVWSAGLCQAFGALCRNLQASCSTLPSSCSLMHSSVLCAPKYWRQQQHWRAAAIHTTTALGPWAPVAAARTWRTGGGVLGAGVLYPICSRMGGTTCKWAGLSRLDQQAGGGTFTPGELAMAGVPTASKTSTQ